MAWLTPSGQTPPMAARQYRDRARALRMALLDAQLELRNGSAPALVLVAGVDGAGKGETVNLLMKWLDPRFVRVRSFDRSSEEEASRPDGWRYWRAMPPRGHIGIFLSAWYSDPLLGRVEGASAEWLRERMESASRLEQMLADDGYGIAKFWLHLDAQSQETRFRALESDPQQSWRVTERDWSNWRRYEQFASAAEEILEATHSPRCPWTVVDGSDSRRRALEVGDGLLRALRGASVSAVDSASRAAPPDAARQLPESDERSAVPRAEYRERLAELQGELNRLHRRMQQAGSSLIVVFEGRDTAGKGGAIRRVVPAFDARCIDIARIGAPSDEERAHHYLWRFWRRVPAAGQIAFFDRSWYGRVLVERVEKLASEEEWSRAYEEINDFERQLVEHGAVVMKFWLHIDKAEQKRRFEERRRVAHKRWKLGEDDLRNRRNWKHYEAALREMLARTDSAHAPWTCISANDKRAARLEVLSTLRDRIAERLGEAARRLEASEPARSA